MEIKELQHVEVIKDVLCDVCGKSTQMNYGELRAYPVLISFFFSN